MQENNKYMELEERIIKLENTIGDWKQSPEFINITQTVEYLFQMTQYLNPNLFEDKLRELEKLLTELKSVVSKKRDPDLLSFERYEIENLYKMSEFALSYYQSLPAIVEKLNGLKYLHDQNTSLINRVTLIEKTQDNIDYMMKESKELINDIKEGMDKNIGMLENNMKNLDQRLAKVIGK